MTLKCQKKSNWESVQDGFKYVVRHLGGNLKHWGGQCAQLGIQFAIMYNFIQGKKNIIQI